MEEGLEALGEAASSFALLADVRGEGLARGNIGDALMRLGRDAEAASEYERALGLLDGHPASQAVIRGNLGNLLRRRGDLEDAERAYLAALATSKELEDLRAIGITQANLASLYMDQGRLDDSEAAYADALALAVSQDDLRTEGLLRGNFGLLQRARGNDAAAISAFEKAITLAQTVGHPGNECLARGNLGDLWFDRGELERAEQQLVAAVAVGDRAFPLAAAAFRGSLGELRVRKGDRAGGLALLREAESALEGRDPVELDKVRKRLSRVL